MSPPIDLARRSLFAAWVLVVGGLVLLAVISRAAPLVGLQPYQIRGASMAPTIPVGALAFVRATDVNRIVVGDVVTIAGSNGAVVTHRVIRVAEINGMPHFEIKGDANGSADPVLIAAAQVVGIVDLTVPLAGYALAVLSMPTGLVSVGSILLGWLIAIWLIDDLAAARASPKPEPAGQPS